LSADYCCTIGKPGCDEGCLGNGCRGEIGAAVSRRIARDGVALSVLDINRDDAECVPQEIVSAGGKAVAPTANIVD
jgi:3-oxoacyl-[acyl-carrier protein] reductase